MNYVEMCRVLHDTNQNVANIKLVASLILRKLYNGGIEPEELEKNLMKIQDSCTYYFQCADNLRYREAYIENPPQPFYTSRNLGEYCNNYVSALEPVIKTHEIDFDFKLSNPDDFFVCDYEKITLILNNLMNNAVRYNNKEKKHVSLSVYIKSGFLYLSVKDNGIGIPKKEICRVTDFGYRASNAKDVCTSGCGYGLNVSSLMIDSLYGEMKIKSKPDEGSEFIVCFPEGRITGFESPGAEIKALNEENMELAFSSLSLE